MSDWIDRRLKFVFLAPAMIVLVALTAFPTVYMFVAAFVKFDASAPLNSKFAGIDNFLRLFTDDKFHNALVNTAVFSVVAVTLEFVLGLAFALLVDTYIRRANFIKTLLILPMMMPTIVVAITWKLMYQPQFGVINDLLGRIGIPPLLWAASAKTAMPSIILIDIWEWTPFVFLMCLAGLASLPQEPFEAAELDGASAFQKFRDLTLPFLKPVIVVTLLLRIMDAFRLFDQVYVLTLGGPAGATETLSFYLYKVTFRFFDIGYAAAISLFMMFVALQLAGWMLKRTSLHEA
ncbi:MAG TPA: sugar ABC transporter permease [Dongiaceae bacterium]|nr:sugar ABC transporter permease [Dongiaceae bacterium]